MFRKKVIGVTIFLNLLITGILVNGCTEDDNPVSPSGTGNANAILSTRLDQGVSYIQAVDVNSASGTVSQANATQIMTDWAWTYSYGASVYVGGYDIAEVAKYSVSSAGTLQKDGALAIPANSWAAGLAFVSTTKAYVSLYATGSVLVFNPTTMAQINSIDLTPYAEQGYLVSPANMLLHDNQLFVALHQMAGQMSFDLKAHIAIIDINADTVIAHLSDTRAAWAATRESVPCMFVDENGDLYIGCSGMFGMAGASVPEGVLRIKRGAMEFDPDYFWDISATTIQGEPAAAAGKTAALYAMQYAGGTRGVGLAINMGYMAEGEDWVTGHYFKPVEFDFVAKTMKVLDIPAGGGYGHGMTKHGDKFLFSFDITGGNGVWEYDPATGAVKKLFASAANPCYIVGIEN